MGTIHLHNIISQYNKWLSVRQTAIAGNVANANTPGFRAVDTEPFSEVLGKVPLTMAAPRPGHLSPAPPGIPLTDVSYDDAWEVQHSGNTVSLEQELMKAGEVNRAFALNTGLLKAFHRMLLSSVKG